MKKILVIDDTKNIRMMLTKCLELEGYSVITASNGKEALEQFQNHVFDLAFLDIKLPEVRGTEVLRQIRSMGIQTPVIIITAYGTVKNAVDCTHLGAVAYVQKPFTADKIRSVLSEFYSRPSFTNSAGTPDNSMDRIARLVAGQQYEEALALLKQAFSPEAGNPEWFLLAGKAYAGLGNVALAEKYLQAYEVFKK